jgi:hypothetical protein
MAPSRSGRRRAGVAQLLFLSLLTYAVDATELKRWSGGGEVEILSSTLGGAVCARPQGGI